MITKQTVCLFVACALQLPSVSEQANYCSFTEFVRCGVSLDDPTCHCTCPDGYIPNGRTDIINGAFRMCIRRCPLEYYFDPLYDCIQCLICPDKKYPSTVCGASSQTICSCVAGTYASDLGSAICTACKQGTYSEIPGAISSSTCQSCASGSYSSAPGLSICVLCGTGTYSSGTGLTACSNCREGTYTVEDGGAKSSSVCQPCSKGTYSSTLARFQICEPCENGKYAPLGGLTTCSACEPGKYNDGNFNSLCNPCADGTFQDQSGESTCNVCSKPKCQQGSTESFCSRRADAQCSICTPVANCVFRGSLCTVNNVVNGVPSCSCRAGFEMQQKGNGVYVCFQCPPETFKPVEGTYTCTNWTAPALLHCERNQFVVPGTQTMDRMCINFPSLPENAKPATGQFTWTCNAGFESIQ
jgi:hypothetical protein